MALFSVKFSLNTQHPIATAVRGSNAPKMEVSVGPMCLMAFTSVMFEMAVAGSANPNVEEESAAYEKPFIEVLSIFFLVFQSKS